MQKEVHDMIWEVDDRSTGVITLEAIRKVISIRTQTCLRTRIRQVLKRLQREKKRMPGTGTNLLRTLVEFMMFDRFNQNRELG